MKQTSADSYVLWFEEIGIGDTGLVGGKNASLGEMFQHLKKNRVQVPNGFAITAAAYRCMLEKAGAFEKLKAVLRGLDTSNSRGLLRGQERRRARSFRVARFPPDVQEAIVAAYRELSKSYRSKNIDVAVRSSATAEDLPTASFAGQQETYLNISGEKELLQLANDVLHRFSRIARLPTGQKIKSII